MKIIKSTELKPYYMYTVYVIDKDGNKNRRGVYQYEGTDGFEDTHNIDHKFKRCDDICLGKKYDFLLIPDELMDRFEFHHHSYIRNGLCDMPPIEGDD